ncbi:glycosyltransferase family 25 protein [Devosia sp. MC532]|uniref:glycosyltransferase family 25 protein n=1 Tax=Devosia sp. MC532 TaxID=2799788 RepID=UPI0018F3A906|nr:glycosyltransferase family 25 protein [Devosia sp. MC532]MBJ7578733.1 glycosyltransferase family 25 protein [Devosia sp. MC532]
MNIYYINLDRRTDRREAMEKRFADLKLNATRISAFTLDDITPELDAKYCAPHLFEPMLRVELACTSSHFRAMRAFLASDAPVAAIFEDDAILAPQLSALFEHIDANGLPCDLLRLETFLDPKSQISVTPVGSLGGYTLHDMQHFTWGAAGYVLTRKAAERYLANHTLHHTIVDRVIWRDLPDTTNLTIRQLVPALVVQEDRLNPTLRVGSDLHGERAHAAQHIHTQKRSLAYELRRFWRYEVKVALPALIHRTLKLSHRTIVPFAGSGVAPESNKA